MLTSIDAEKLLKKNPTPIYDKNTPENGLIGYKTVTVSNGGGYYICLGSGVHNIVENMMSLLKR